MIHQQINLYHPIFRREPKLFSAGVMLRAWLALAALGLVATAFDAWQVESLSGALANARQTEQIAATRLASADNVFGVGRARARLAALQRRAQTLKGLGRFLRQSRRAEIGPAPVLIAMSHGVLPGLWITQFSLDRRHRALRVAGHSLHPALVPLFLHRVVAGPSLAGYRFRGLVIKRTRVAGRYRPYVNFDATTTSAAAKARAAAAVKGAT